MGLLQEYLLRVTGAAVICGVLTALVGKSGVISKLMSLLCALFMTIILLSPLVSTSLNGFIGKFDGIRAEADAVVDEGKNRAREEIAVDIQTRLEAYIQEQAAVFGADVRIKVEITEEGIPAPCGVSIEGSVAPYAKGRLSAWIKEELGIGLEAQEWINKT